MGHAEERIASQQAASFDNQQSQVGSPTPDRQSTGSTYSRSRSSDDGICSHCSSTINSRSQNSRTSQPTSPRLLSRTPSDKGEEFVDGRLYTPPRWTNPGLASSIPYSRSVGSSISPLRRELSHSTPPEGVDAVTSRAARHDIARRLTQLARRLACDEPNSTNDVMLGNQLEQLEKVVWASPSPEPKRHQYQPSFESPLRSDAGSSFGSPVSSLFKSRFSDLSASLQREREVEKQLEGEEPPPKRGMSEKQAKKVIAEMGKLNDELSAVVNNLKARQEESEVGPDLLQRQKGKNSQPIRPHLTVL